MTPPDTAEIAADTILEPIPAAQIDHEQLYDVFRRLLRVANVVIRDVDKNAADFHRDMEQLRAATKAGTDLLFPPPLPDAPDEATVLYAHAVNPRDRVWINGEWNLVAAAPSMGARRPYPYVSWVLSPDSGCADYRTTVHHDAVFPVQRDTKRKDDTPGEDA